MILSPNVSHNVDPASVANYILHLDEQREDSDVTQMKLHKLLYLAQAHYLAATGYRLMDSDVEAFEHGPVIKAVFPMFRKYGREVIVNHRPFAPCDLPQDVKDFVKQLWDLYSDYSASYLRKLTHDQDPWKDNYVPNTRHVLIPDNEILKFFAYKVPCNERVIHPDALLVDEDFLDTLDDDALAATALEALV